MSPIHKHKKQPNTSEYCMLFCMGVKSDVTLSKICNVKVFENRVVFGSQEEVMHIYCIHPAKR
jgi:hypothetical protein